MKARQTRHSKVYTSRGARDRRVRLSALTAIQFYDVQDRLGYERSSEAVDWLLLKAKASIEALPKKPNAISPYSADQEKLTSLQHFGVGPVNISGSCPVMENSMPGFNYIADPFLAIGSQENLMLQEQTLISLPEFLPSSCLDQVVYSASLFSEQDTPIQRSVFSSALASSMDAPLSFASKTPGTGLTLPIQFQIGE